MLLRPGILPVLFKTGSRTRKKIFNKLASDTALIGSLVDQTYTEQTLQQLLDTKKATDYTYMMKRNFDVPPPLLFWNTQLILPVKTNNGRQHEWPHGAFVERALHKEDSMRSKLERLSNGLYIHTARVLFLRNDRRLVADALIPVMRKWQFNVETENLQKEFVGLSAPPARLIFPIR